MIKRVSVAISILAMTTFLAACGDDGDGKAAKPTVTAGPVDTPTAGPTETPGLPTETPGEPTTTATPGEETPIPTATATPGDEAGLIAPLVDSPPTGIDDPLWADVAALEPELSNQSTGLIYGMCQLNMSGTYDGLPDFNGGEPGNLQMKAVHDGEKIYILAEWNDTEFNLDRRRWLYDGPTDPLKDGETADGWTSQLNDDKIGLAFEIDSASSGFGSFDEAGCAASCHNAGEGLDMRPAEGSVDIWHWKTSRSEPLGYVNDQITTPEEGRVTDAGTGIENRNRISDNCSGAMVEWDGTEQAFMRWDGEMITLDPAYILLGTNAMDSEGDAEAGDSIYQTSCAGCHGADGGGGFGPALNEPGFTRESREHLAEEMAEPSHPGSSAWTGLSVEEQTDVLARLRGFSGIPGYYLMQPEGSAADIVTESNVDYEMVDDDALMRTNYQLLMIRDLDTGNEDDATLGVGEDIVFGVALMDNDGRNHIGSARNVLFLEAGTAAATITR